MAAPAIGSIATDSAVTRAKMVRERRIVVLLTRPFIRAGGILKFLPYDPRISQIVELAQLAAFNSRLVFWLSL